MKRLLHIYATAARLSTSPGQVERLIDRGELQALTLPDGSKRVDVDDLSDWVQRAKVTQRQLTQRGIEQRTS